MRQLTQEEQRKHTQMFAVLENKDLVLVSYEDIGE